MLSAKTCFKCGATKPIDDFYRHPETADGHLGKCKDCTKRDVGRWYRRTRKARSDYEKRRSKSRGRRKRVAAYGKSQRQRNQLKVAARAAVARALRSGTLVKAPCWCGSRSRVQAHHEDYSRPLDVEWLCFKHHREHRHGQVVIVQAPAERDPPRETRNR